MTVNPIGCAELLLYGLIGSHDASEKEGSNVRKLNWSMFARWWEI